MLIATHTSHLINSLRSPDTHLPTHLALHTSFTSHSEWHIFMGYNHNSTFLPTCLAKRRFDCLGERGNPIDVVPDIGFHTTIRHINTNQPHTYTHTQGLRITSPSVHIETMNMYHDNSVPRAVRRTAQITQRIHHLAHPHLDLTLRVPPLLETKETTSLLRCVSFFLSYLFQRD